MTASNPDIPLVALRREIDLIDDQVLHLLIQRFVATERVRASKAQDGSISSSPFRPAREAVIMRRLAAESEDRLPPELLVRLWRVILSASIQLQAPVTLHMDAALGQDLSTRILIAQHFCGMAVVLHPSPKDALAALLTAQGDLAVIATSSDWAQGFAPREKGGAQVIGTLPVLMHGNQPQLLIFGHAEPQASGDDETLVLIPGQDLDIVSNLWQAHSGTYTLVSLPGFLEAAAPLLHDVLTRFPGARIAGSAPRPLKVFP